MPDWLTATAKPLWAAAEPLLTNLLLATALGFAVAGIYRRTLGRRPCSPALPTTLVLLAVLVAFVMMAVGDNSARAFGLVGILSIVRFRSVVEDTRDTAFVVFAVAVGMAAGAGAGLLAAVGVPVVAAVAAVTAWRDGRRADPVTAKLTVRLAADRDPSLLGEPLARLFRQVRPTGAGTAKTGGLEFVYTVAVADPALLGPAATELSRLDGVTAVELKAD